MEVPVEADLKQHGLPRLIGILDLVQEGKIVDYKTSGQTPNPDRVAHTAEVQTSIYALLYRENTGRQEQGHRAASPREAEEPEGGDHASSRR